MVLWGAFWTLLPSGIPCTAVHKVPHLCTFHANSSSGVGAPLSISCPDDLQACLNADGAVAPELILVQ